MSVLEVRPATADDIGAIAALGAARPFTANWPARELSYELTRLDSIFLVADEGGFVRGYALGRVSECDCLLLDFASAADGSGRGRALMAALKEAAKARACAKIALEVSASNARALAFYEKSGAKVVGRRPKFYYDGSDAVLMDIDLG